MEEKKPTDEEVIKLLEIFANDDEPDGVDRLARMALDLIHRLQAEIERLKERAKLDLECEKKWGKLLKEQAVKDTAKEILQFVGDIVDDGDDRFKYKDYQWHKRLCERYGVEVE